MPSELVLEISRHPFFDGIPIEVAEWFDEHGEFRELKTGDLIFRGGDKAEWMYLMLEGRASVVSPNGTNRFFIQGGEVGGKLPYSRMTAYGGDGVIGADTRVVQLHESRFNELGQVSPELVQRLIGTMSDRIRHIAQVSLNEQKLASLGTMAAGLAHELNNPASAAKSAASRLQEVLVAFDKASSQIVAQTMFEEMPDTPYAFQDIEDVITLDGLKLSAMEQSEREDGIGELMEEYDIDEAWEFAPILAEVGFTEESLRNFLERLKPEKVRDFLYWVPRNVEMRLLCDELKRSTERLSGLVNTMKRYSYMDRGEEKDCINIEPGIDDTLDILRHKLKQTTIEVVRDYHDTEPVPAFGGQLNQVWTNIIDNAIHAVSKSDGVITIRTRQPNESTVVVEIEDNGRGIPEDVKSRIFDPFFTTKGPQEGTGLGLDIARRIVVVNHQGTIDVQSEPGKTVMQVFLPTERAMKSDVT